MVAEAAAMLCGSRRMESVGERIKDGGSRRVADIMAHSPFTHYGRAPILNVDLKSAIQECIGYYSCDGTVEVSENMTIRREVVAVKHLPLYGVFHLLVACLFSWNSVWRYQRWQDAGYP